MLHFFSTEDRIHSLKNADLQKILDSVLFEPSNFLYFTSEYEIPQEVPCIDRNLLSTVGGLLINEIQCSPDMLLEYILKLLKLSIDLDVGTFHSMTVTIVLFIIRVTCRVESYLAYLAEYGLDTHESIRGEVRTINIQRDTIDKLTSGIASIRQLFSSRFQPMIESWCLELTTENDQVAAVNQDGITESNGDGVIDRNTRHLCSLHAHLLLMFRNVKACDYDFDVASTILSSFLFLTTRHTWNLNLLVIPEHQLFEMIAKQRRNLISYLRSLGQSQLNEVLESSIQVTVGTGGRLVAKESTHLQSTRSWGYIDGSQSVGRFTVSSTRRKVNRSAELEDVSEGNIQTVHPSTELGIEIDTQLIQLTLKSSHLKALDTAIASDLDVQAIFGKQSIQGSILESTENRLWVNLVGRGHDIQYWRTPDQRTCVQDYDREYAPGDVEPSEEWLVPLLEPVRLTYMTQPFVLQIFLPDKPLDADAEVAVLIGIHPKAGGTWKEIFVNKILRTVQVFNILSHGRRFYRVLEYTTDVRSCFREMQPSIKNRQTLWPVWERFGAGHPCTLK